MNLEMKWLGGLALSVGGLTLFFPLMAAIGTFFLKKGRAFTKLPSPPTPIRLEILIPAYNEAHTIEQTLASVRRAIKKLHEVRADAQIEITVGFDGSTDSTRSIVAAFAADAGVLIKMLDRDANRGKWSTIVELAFQSRGFWSALVDSGSLWPENFLVEIASKLETSHCVGIAPGYRHTSGGALVRLIWWQERALKSLENLAGGPFSLHGATMIFRTKELCQALAELSADSSSQNRSWLNDDVVIGLILRKKGRIDYLGDSICVGDCGIKESGGEIQRRKRLILGNVEWIQSLFPQTLNEAPLLALLALRRIMRVLWAYHLLFSVFCMGMLLGAGWLLSIGTAALIAGVGAMSRRLREAGWVSLTAPMLLFRKNSPVTWS